MTERGWVRAVVAVLATCVAPMAVAAQTPDTLPVLLPGLRITVERTATEEGGAARLVVPLDTLAPRIAASAEDVLRETPLIRIRRNARGQAQPFLRGGDDRQVAVLVDGVPITLGYDHRADLSVLPVTGARTLAFTRGPAPLSFGPNVTLGAVELDVGGATQGAPPPPGLRLAAVGTAPAGVQLEARAGGRVGLSSRLLDVHGGAWFVDRPGLAVPGGAEPSPWLEGPDGLRMASDLRRHGGFLSARLGGPSSGWVGVTGVATDGDRGVEPETHVETPRFWRYPEESAQMLVGSAGTPGFRTSLGELTATVHGGLRTSDLLIEDYASAAYAEVAGTERWDDRTSTVRGVLQLRPSPSAVVRLSGTASSTRHLEAIDAGPEQRYRQRLWSGAVEGSWSVGAVEVDLGVALDAADTPAAGDKPPLARQEAWGARAGLAWSARPGLRLHTAAARRVRFPSLRELYAGPLSRFEPNPELEPERLAAIEGGATWTGGRGTLQVVGFHRDLADGIVRVALPGTRPPRFQRQNLDLVRSTGLELLLDGTLGPVDVRGDMTLQRVRGSEDGATRDVDYAPARAGAVAVGTTLPWKVRGEAAARWESEQTCRSPGTPESGTFSSDPALDLELRRGFRLAGSGLPGFLEATVRLDNVTDALVFDQCGLPRPGRTLSVGIRIR
ncbi:MAG TPA: TonB-dependent receptor [Longimicrobiales bacterium]|nr:TonB-dependent receptor [Longimicrobiales bacterium]